MTLDLIKRVFKYTKHERLMRLATLAGKQLAESYNDKVYAIMEQQLEIEVQKFRDTYEFNHYGENEEYEKELFSWPLPAGNGLFRSIPYKEKMINRKYFSNNLTVEYIDYYQLPKYCDFVRTILNNLRFKIEKHLTRFDEGKYISLSEIKIEQDKLKISGGERMLIDAPQSQQENKTKLKTTLTAGQLLYLFKTLKNIGTIDSQISNIDLCRFIAANISTKGSAALSPENLSKVWSNIDPNDIAYWADKFPDMSKQVIKDNPLKIKYKDNNSK